MFSQWKIDRMAVRIISIITAFVLAVAVIPNTMSALASGLGGGIGASGVPVRLGRSSTSSGNVSNRIDVTRLQVSIDDTLVYSYPPGKLGDDIGSVTLRKNSEARFSLAWKTKDENQYFKDGDFFDIPIMKSSNIDLEDDEPIPVYYDFHGNSIEVGTRQFLYNKADGLLFYRIVLNKNVEYYQLLEGKASGSASFSLKNNMDKLPIEFGDDDGSSSDDRKYEFPVNISGSTGDISLGLSKGDIQFVKADATTHNKGEGEVERDLFDTIKGIPNVTFEVYEKGTGGNSDKLTSFVNQGDYYLALPTGSVKEVTTNQDGTFALRLGGLYLQKEYYLKEKASPEGYYTNGEKIEFKPNKTEGVYSIINNQPRIVQLTKVDESGNRKLSGAVFDIYQENGIKLNGFTKTGDHYVYDKTGSDALTTAQDGLLKVYNLPEGKFYFQEKAAPEGYILSNKKYEFELSVNIPKGTASDPIIVDIKHVENQAKYAAQLIKVDKDGNLKLQGAVFGLYKEDGTELKNFTQKDNIYYCDGTGTDKLTTSANGVLKVDGLSVGKYYFKEVSAPQGYILSDKTYSFEIKASSSQTQIVADIGSVENEAIKRQMIAKLTKVDESGNLMLQGAEFEIYKADDTKLEGFSKNGDSYIYDGTGTAKLVTPAGGILEVYGLSEGSYYFKEVSAPEGYILSNKTYSFTLADNQNSAGPIIADIGHVKNQAKSNNENSENSDNENSENRNNENSNSSSTSGRDRDSDSSSGTTIVDRDISNRNPSKDSNTGRDTVEVDDTRVPQASGNGTGTGTGTSASGGTSSGGVNNPNTGSNMPALPIILLIAAASGLYIFISLRKKNNDSN